jgi:hypothetical protein
MRKFCLSFALLLCATPSVPIFAQEVILLPEDGGLWHTTLVLPSDPSTDHASQRLVDHFTTSPRLKKLASQTSLHRYTPSDPLFEARYAPYFGGVIPALLVQKADGGEAIPASSEELANEIAQAIDQCCPLRPKPQPKPQPSPEPSPSPTITPHLPSINIEVVPDIRPTVVSPPEDSAEQPKKAPNQAPLSPLLLLAPIAAGALGLRRNHRGIF